MSELSTAQQRAADQAELDAVRVHSLDFGDVVLIDGEQLTIDGIEQLDNDSYRLTGTIDGASAERVVGIMQPIALVRCRHGERCTDPR